MKTEQIKEENISLFLRHIRKTESIFRNRIKKESGKSVLIAENESQLSGTVSESLRAFRNIRRLPAFRDGMPYLYRFAENFLERNKETLSEKTVRAALNETGNERMPLFYDEELFLLPHFFILAGAALYNKENDEKYLHDILTICGMDFSGIFFAFSKIEKIFLSEAVGIYAQSDTATKYLYHKRLSRYAEERKKDPVSVAKQIVAAANEKNTHIGEILPKIREGGVGYFSFLFLMTAALLTVFLLTNDAGAWNFLLVFLAAVPIFSFSKIWLALFFADAGEKNLPALSHGEAMEKTRVLVSIATFLYGDEKDQVIFDKLEDFYLTNGAENIAFAVLGDLPQSKKRNGENDETVFSYAKARISALREKYGDCFYLFIRRRRRSESEGAYIGWERKRGGVLELCRFLRGGKTTLIPFFDTDEKLLQTKYLLTLDADTNLYIGAVRELLGMMVHPENTPVFDAKKGRVVHGHAVIQPRMIPSLLLSSDSAFAALTGGAAGLDSYAKAASDLYQELFDEGIYCGKGILDIDVFLHACDGFFPLERILSHDLAEGNLLRAALATQTVLSDGTPKNALSYYMRQHRWLRGDLQILPYLRRLVRNEQGAWIQNPMTLLSRFKIADNFLRASEPLLSLFLLAFGFAVGGKTAFVCTFFVLLPIVWRAWETAFFGICHRGFTALSDALKTLCFSIASMAYEGYLFADACVRVLYRFSVSRKNFLNWTTAFEGDRISFHSLDGYYRRFLPSVLIGVFFLLFPFVFSGVLGILWILFPLGMWYLSREKQGIHRPDGRERARLLVYTRDAWQYFRDYVNEKTHFLPPDNVQFFPTYAVAMRTSPTNIGMYLLSLLAARDLDFIGKEEFLFRAQATEQTLEALNKWNGHLYNWYDLHTLAILGEGFVSTVDSGNFVASLIAFCEGAKEYVGESPALVHVISTFSRMVHETDFSALYMENRKLFSIGYSVREGKFSNSCYDTFMSEARTSSFLAVALRQIPTDHYFALGRRVIGKFGRYGVASWSGTAFEYFMPGIFLPRVKGSLGDFALSYAYRMQKQNAVKGKFFGKKRSIFGISESGYFAFDAQLNYQYRAFGIAELARDPVMKTGRIVAPYASFLMLENNPSEVIANLETMEDFDMYGKYGFYEALDFDHSRVGGGFAVLRSFMAHHVGMSILSTANFLLDDIFVKRFLREPHMRAARELMAEKIPTSVHPLPKKRERPVTSVPLSVTEDIFVPEPRANRLLSPETVLLSNNKTKLFLSSSGHIECINGRDAVFISDFYLFSLTSGMRVYVNIDGVVFPTVSLGMEPENYVGEFVFLPGSELAEYRSYHRGRDGKKYEIRLRLSVFPDAECAEISCRVSGDYKNAFAFLYFEPILTEKRAYLAHKSFSDLFLESEYMPDEETLLFKRRPRNGAKDTKYLGVMATPSQSPAFESMKDRCFALLPSEKDYALLADGEREFTGSAGALILPVCAFRSGTVSFGEQISFYLGMSRDADDLLYQMQKCREKKERKQRSRKMGALLQLQYASAGLSAPAEAFERFLLGKLIFSADKQREPHGFALDKNVFWKHSVSGDNPIVLARMAEGTEDEFSRLFTLLCLFKYLCIRGIRYDFVIWYREDDAYAQPIRHKMLDMVERAGCEKFMSWSCGIYILNENVLSEYEKFAFLLTVGADFLLSETLADSMNGMGGLQLSHRAEILLKKESFRNISSASMPCVERVKETKSGFFHKEGFLVRKPHGKTPFAHILASPNFGTVLTENSLGFTFARNAGMQKLTPHTADGFYEDMGERLILRIYDSADKAVFEDYDLCASAAWVDFRFDGVYYHGRIGNVEYTVSVALLGLHDVKKIKVSLQNAFGEISARIAYAVFPCLGSSPSEPRYYRYRKGEKGVRVISLANASKKNFSMALFSPDTESIYTDEAAFRSDGAVFEGKDRMAVLSAKKVLTGKTEMTFFLTACFSEKQYLFLQKICSFGKAFIEKEPKNKRAILELESGHPLFDAVVNGWSFYQTAVSRIYARSGFYQVSGAYGFRDQLQDALALIPVSPKEAKILILRAAAHQYEEGDVQHWWHESEKTGIRTRCSDDFLWLPYVTEEYVRQTGDQDILSLSVPYLRSAPLSEGEYERYERTEKSELREPLFLHLLRAVKNGRRFGAHGLPLIGTCDWNDGMNLVGAQGKGESVWLAFFQILVLRKMKRLCRIYGDFSEISEMENEEQMLYVALQKHGFDGEWYRRGYYDDGSVLGGKERQDCRIDVLPQAFSSILAHESGFEKEKAKMSMRSVGKLLFDRKHSLVRLLYPPFDKDTQSPGYIKGYVPGIRENGGQYTHAAVWAALGFFLCGDYERGTEVLFAINPAERYQNPKIAEAYRIEPYVFAGDVYTNPQHMGRGGWSFYTGSASWYRKTVLEILCGYTEEKEGFYMNPRLSSKFSSFRLRIEKNNTVYRISVSLADRSALSLDGKPMGEGKKYFFRFDGAEHEAVLKIRKE
ncbi:MAG: DUF3131 domain-containing protein [Clostridia bacterium]|nr:DUF3131 domain-containing protein [Clostridia bacterium]